MCIHNAQLAQGPEKEKSIRKCLPVQCGMYENSIAIQEYRIRFAIISYTCPLLKVLRTPEGILEIMNGGEQQRGGRFSEGRGVKGKGGVRVATYPKIFSRQCLFTGLVKRVVPRLHELATCGQRESGGRIHAT